MRYASGNIDDLNRIKQQMTMEAITQGTAEHIMHHVMINFILNGEMRFMQFDFTRESADTKNVFLFVEDYTVPQQQMMLCWKKAGSITEPAFLCIHGRTVSLFCENGQSRKKERPVYRSQRRQVHRR